MPNLLWYNLFEQVEVTLGVSTYFAFQLFALSPLLPNTIFVFRPLSGLPKGDILLAVATFAFFEPLFRFCGIFYLASPFSEP